MAFLSTLMTNLTISVHGKKNAKQTNLMDFMPKWDTSIADKDIKVQSIDEMKKAMLEIYNTQNKKEARKKANSSRPPSKLKDKK